MSPSVTLLEYNTRYPKVGERIGFVKYRIGKTGVAYGYGKVTEVIDRDHVRVDEEPEILLDMFCPETGKIRTLTWSDKYKGWRGKRGNKVLP